MARISKMLNPARDNSRIDTAMTENESNAPTIQRTTRAILLSVTCCPLAVQGMSGVV
jgi:hypothetical protein